MRAALFAVLSVCACASDGDQEVLPPVVLAMVDTAPPTYDDGQQQIFQVTREVPLPFRRPESGERPSGDLAPYPDMPFHVASDSRITVRFTLSNLDDQKRVVELLIDPWNEFVRYVPGISNVGEDEILPNFSGIQRMFVLPPKGRIEGIITPDDMVELATDLTTAMSLRRRPPDAMGELGGAVLYNRAFNIQNRSSEPDPVLRDWLPGPKSTVAAVTGFDLGLRTGAPARVAVEIVIDVVDLNGNRVVNTGEDDRKLRRPGTALSPPAAAAN
jgi:hypothetical protein